MKKLLLLITGLLLLFSVKGLLLFNDTEGVLQIYNGSTWVSMTD